MTNKTDNDRILTTVVEARALGEAAMRGAGYDEDDARILTDHVLDAALYGYEYSGLPKLLNVVMDRMVAAGRWRRVARSFLIVAALTGMRRGELRALTSPQVDLKQRRITLTGSEARGWRGVAQGRRRSRSRRSQRPQWRKSFQLSYWRTSASFHHLHTFGEPRSGAILQARSDGLGKMEIAAGGAKCSNAAARRRPKSGRSPQLGRIGWRAQLAPSASTLSSMVGGVPSAGLVRSRSQPQFRLLFPLVKLDALENCCTMVARSLRNEGYDPHDNGFSQTVDRLAVERRSWR
jgi:hypothetical protein